jgi:hypothetical protein
MMTMMTFFDARGSFCVFLHSLSTFYLRKTIIERTSLKPHKDDDDTEHVPGVLPSSSRGENGIIIIDIIIIDIIIIDIIIAGLSSASFSDEKK